ncbi:TPA: ABC-three component system middle component 7 [Streptococcus suis]
MKLPNKAVSYQQSILSKFPLILGVLEKGDYYPHELYQKLNTKFEGISEYTNSLTCLYALGEIELTTDGVLHYVKRN